MNRHHPCVGGPLDGQNVAKPDYIKRFEVAQLPPRSSFALFDPSTANEAPTLTSITHVTYTLTRIADGSLIWQA
jgi:hypothetical protein